MKEFSFKAKNFNDLSRLFKFQLSKYNDLYLFPGLPASSRLAQSGFHISFHASGQAHLALNSPVACLRLGPKLYLPFNRTDLLNDIVATKNSLFKNMDVSDVAQGGVIAILKTESMITNFLNSVYVKNYLTNPRFIDYYNLILTNPYRPTSDFISSFPYNRFDVDATLIENSIKIEEGKNLCELFASLKNNGIIETYDLIAMVPFNESFIIIMSGNLIGLRIDLDKIMNTINKLPGAKIFLDLIKRLAKLY